MEVLLGNYKMAFVALLVCIVMLIALLPTYQEWKSKRLTAKLRMRLEQEKRERISKRFSPTDIPPPRRELSPAV